MQDAIVREVIINAPQEDVYDAIANPEKLIQWFPEALEGTYAVGEQPLFVFEGHGKVHTYIVDAKPYEYFSYMWVPGNTSFVGDVRTVPHTLVEFRIETQDDGSCKVILTESGFASLPDDVAEKSLNMNSGGWDYYMDAFAKYFDKK